VTAPDPYQAQLDKVGAHLAGMVGMVPAKDGYVLLDRDAYVSVLRALQKSMAIHKRVAEAFDRATAAAALQSLVDAFDKLNSKPDDLGVAS
jgi:hypothetical protein